MRSQRTKGFIGSVIDGKKLADICNKIYDLQYSENATCKVSDLLLIELKAQDECGNNKFAVICSEGVGWEQDFYRTIEVPTNVGQFGLYNGRVHISIEVIKTCLTDKTVDVSEYIRTFGQRLDDNCWLWQAQMVGSLVPSE